jgi:hypothetical protein
MMMSGGETSWSINLTSPLSYGQYNLTTTLSDVAGNTRSDSSFNELFIREPGTVSTTQTTPTTYIVPENSHSAGTTTPSTTAGTTPSGILTGRLTEILNTPISSYQPAYNNNIDLVNLPPIVTQLSHSLFNMPTSLEMYTQKSYTDLSMNPFDFGAMNRTPLEYNSYRITYIEFYKSPVSSEICFSPEAALIPQAPGKNITFDDKVTDLLKDFGII